jgi:thiamine monophosphate synthase
MRKGVGRALLTSQKMALQVLQVQVCLVAVRALVLAVGVLGGLGRRLARSRSRSARMCGQDTATALLTDDVHGLRLLVCKHRRVRVQRRMVHAHTAGGATHLVVLGGSGGQQRRLRVGRRHGHVGRGRGLDGPQRRVLQRGHCATAIGGGGHRRVRRLRRLGVAVVAAIHRRERRGAVERRQRGQRLLRACVVLLAQALVLGQARLAEAVGVHNGGEGDAIRVSQSVVMEMRRDQLVLSVTISFDEPQVRATRVTGANAPTGQHKESGMGQRRSTKEEALWSLGGEVR